MIRHAPGVTRFTHAAQGIMHDLTVFVDASDPVKFTVLSLSNRSGRRRKLSVFGYNEWILGPPRPGEEYHVVTELDAETGAILAQESLQPGVCGKDGLCLASASDSVRQPETGCSFSAATDPSPGRPR